MKVVLTKTVEKIGVLGETKDVKLGFARNYLFPKRYAVLATDPSARTYRAQHRAAFENLAKQRSVIAELADSWRGQTYSLTARASEDGTLYGSIGAKEVKKLLGRDDLEIDVPALKTVGTHAIEIGLADGSKVPVTIVIEPEARAGTRNRK